MTKSIKNIPVIEILYFGLSILSVVIVLLSPLKFGVKISVCTVFFLLSMLYVLKHRQAKRRFVQFTGRINELLDSAIAVKEIDPKTLLDETLDAKIAAKLQKVVDITHGNARQSKQQKKSVERLISDISHQLKTPMTNIKLAAETLQDETLEEPQKIFFLSGLVVQVEQLAFLIDAIVKMSRMETGIIAPIPEITPLLPSIKKAIASVQTKADQKGIVIVCETIESAAYFDSKWTEEALLNVLDNALKYSPEGSTVFVTITPLTLYTRVDVQDNGIGVLPQNQTNVFKRFYRENRQKGTSGVGVGLYLTRQILTQQKGYITLQSDGEKGTTISLYFSNYSEDKMSLESNSFEIS